MISIKQGIYYLIHNRASFCDAIVKNFLFFLPDKMYLSLRYRCLMGHWINWKHPKTFSEKLQWLKVYGFKAEYTRLVDKLAVKDYVASKIGKKYIIPTLGVWDKVEDIDWDALPNQFVLKTTHGGGSCGVVICSDKANFDREKAIRKLETSMRTNAGQTYRERPYLNVPRKIIAEKFMAERKTDGKPIETDLPDYKFFCFNGEPKYCQVIRDRSTKETIDFYDMEWNLMPFVGLNPVAKNGTSPIAKPLHFDNMIKICRKLSKNMKFSRIDLYVINDKEYFGEITLYPATGFGEFTPEEWNKRLGDLIKLDGTKTGGVKFKVEIINGKCINIENRNSFEDLKDYKFFCFGGRVKCFKIDFGRFVEHHANYYYPQGELLPFGEKGLEPDPNHVEIMPENLDEMIRIAENLSKGFKFLRVDLYNVKGRVYFGELTFYPAAGMGAFVPDEWDYKLGDLIIC